MAILPQNQPAEINITIYDSVCPVCWGVGWLVWEATCGQTGESHWAIFGCGHCYETGFYALDAPVELIEVNGSQVTLKVLNADGGKKQRPVYRPREDLAFWPVF